MILEDLENFKQDLRHHEKKEKTIKQYSNYINDFIEATQIENKEDILYIYNDCDLNNKSCSYSKYDGNLKQILTDVNYVKEKNPGKEIAELNLNVNGDFIDLSYTLANDVPFERIRRITGYLVGTLDRFNDGKRAEEKDRVKHDVLL